MTTKHTYVLPNETEETPNWENNIKRSDTSEKIDFNYISEDERELIINVLYRKI